MQVVIERPAVPTGEVKSFGHHGPKYKVGQPIRQADDGDWMVSITMVATGEQAEYRLSRINNDPEAD